MTRKTLGWKGWRTLANDLDIIAPVGVPVRRVLLTDSKDVVAEKLMLLDRLSDWLKETKAQVIESAEEFIRDNGPVECGSVVYFLGVTKKPPKCIDVPGTIEALMQACQGDFEKFCEHLAANAIKYGAAKATLPPREYDLLFKVEEVEELQCEEAAKAAKKLQKLDRRFLPT